MRWEYAQSEIQKCLTSQPVLTLLALVLLPQLFRYWDSFQWWRWYHWREANRGHRWGQRRQPGKTANTRNWSRCWSLHWPGNIPKKSLMNIRAHLTSTTKLSSVSIWLSLMTGTCPPVPTIHILRVHLHHLQAPFRHIRRRNKGFSKGNRHWDGEDSGYYLRSLRVLVWEGSRRGGCVCSVWEGWTMNSVNIFRDGCHSQVRVAVGVCFISCF